MTHRMTKQQLEIMDALNNGGYIWTASGMPYLAKCSGGMYKSSLINRKTFTALVEGGVLERDPVHQNRWVPKT